MLINQINNTFLLSLFYPPLYLPLLWPNLLPRPRFQNAFKSILTSFRMFRILHLNDTSGISPFDDHSINTLLSLSYSLLTLQCRTFYSPNYKKRWDRVVSTKAEEKKEYYWLVTHLLFVSDDQSQTKTLQWQSPPILNQSSHLQCNVYIVESLCCPNQLYILSLQVLFAHPSTSHLTPPFL